jgi:hypothetical protein
LQYTLDKFHLYMFIRKYLWLGYRMKLVHDDKALPSFSQLQ